MNRAIFQQLADTLAGAFEPRSEWWEHWTAPMVCLGLSLLVTIGIFWNDAGPVPTARTPLEEAIRHDFAAPVGDHRGTLLIENAGPMASVVMLRSLDNGATMAQVYCPAGQKAVVRDLPRCEDVYAIASAGASISVRRLR